MRLNLNPQHGVPCFWGSLSSNYLFIGWALPSCVKKEKKKTMCHTSTSFESLPNNLHQEEMIEVPKMDMVMTQLENLG